MGQNELAAGDQTARRRFREQENRQRPLVVFDRTMRGFGFRIADDDTRKYFVRVVRKPGAANITLGKSTELSAEKARGKAVAEIEAAQVERKAGPLMRSFAEELVHRRAHR